MQQDRLVTLRLLRTLGYVIFIIGRLCFSWQVVIAVFNRGGRQAVSTVKAQTAMARE